MLEALGFEWSAYEAKWMSGFVQLGRFVRRHGIGSVPTYNQDRKLRSWVEEQRRQYRRLFEVNHSGTRTASPYDDQANSGGGGGGRRRQPLPPSLSKKRRELLDLLGFPWPTIPEQPDSQNSGANANHRQKGESDDE